MLSGSFEIFMLVVEEMSFTKAAKRAFLTQQCVSDHIKRLERSYGARLFERRPKLSLTPAGEVMYRSMLQIQNMSGSMETKIREIARGAIGELRVGMNSTRAKILMPKLFRRYHAAYPAVSISIFSDDTPMMGQMLIKGRLDLFLAVDVTSNPLYKVINMSEDCVYVILSDGLLDRYFPEGPEEVRKAFAQGADLSRFEGVPFVRNYPTSTINNLLNTHINRFNFNLETIFQVSDYDTQLQLCASDQVAAFAPSLMLRNILRFNETNPDGVHLNVFPIKDMHDTLRVDCVHLKNSYLPQYVLDFIEMVSGAIAEEKAWLAERGFA